MLRDGRAGSASRRKRSSRSPSRDASTGSRRPCITRKTLHQAASCVHSRVARTPPEKNFRILLTGLLNTVYCIHNTKASSLNRNRAEAPGEGGACMYTKILVPLDGSALAERAIVQAEEIARAAGAELILIQVVQAPLGQTPEAGQAEEEKAFRETAAQARAYLGMVAT